MAESDKIKATDIIEEKVFEPTIKEGRELLGILKELEAGFKGILVTTSKKISVAEPKTVEDVEKLNDALKEVDETEKGLIETQKKIAIETKKLADLTTKEALALAKLREQTREQSKANKEAARDQLGLTTAYQKASKQLNDLRNAYKNLTIAGREQGAVGRGLLQTIQEQDTRLKSLDATVGQHQRNVGNYSGAILTATKGLSGFAGIIARVGSLLGFNTAALADSVHASKELVTVAKDISKASKATQLATAGDTVAKKENVVATQQLGFAQRLYGKIVGQSTGLMKGFRLALAATGIGAIVFLLYEAASAMGLFSSETEDTVDGTKELENATRELNDALNELAVTQLKNTAKILAAKLAADGKSLDLTKKLSDAERAVIEEQLKFNKQKIDQNIVDQEKLYNDLGQLVTNQIDNTKSVYAVLDTEDRKYLENKSAGLTKEQREQLELQLIESKKANASLIQESENLKTELLIQEINFGKDVRDINKGDYEKRLKAEYDFRRQIEDIKNSLIQDERVRAEERLKLDADRRIKDVENSKASAETKAELIRLIEEKLLQDIYGLNAKYVEDQTKLDQSLIDKRKALREQSDKDFIDARKQRRELEEESKKERLENEKNARDKRIEEELKAADLLNDAIFDGLEERSRKKEEMLDKELQQIEDAIRIQQDLASRGLDNTLAFEEKRKAESIAKKIELEKKARKQEQAQQLANVFLEFLKSYAKEGAIGAPAKALAQTLIAKGISDVIAGNFATGVENFQGKGTETSDSNLIGFSKGESVVTAAGTKENPGLTTAMNQGNVMDYFKDNYLPQYHQQLHSDKSRRSQVDGAMLALLDQKLTDLQKTIKHKKETSINWDGHGNMVREEVEHGIRKHITRQRRSF